MWEVCIAFKTLGDFHNETSIRQKSSNQTGTLYENEDNEKKAREKKIRKGVEYIIREMEREESEFRVNTKCTNAIKRERLEAGEESRNERIFSMITPEGAMACIAECLPIIFFSVPLALNHSPAAEM